MTTRLLGFIATIAVATGLSIAPIRANSDKKTATPGVAGTWTLSVDSPHGRMTMGFVLTQDGRKVTGTFSSPHGDMPVEGEFADGALTLATIATEGNPLQVTFTGKLNEKGALAGSCSSQMGEMTWTAERLKDK